MSPALIKIILIVGYALFVLVAKMVKAARSSHGPGGVSIPQGTFIKPHPRPQPTTVQTRPALRVAPVVRKAVPKTFRKAPAPQVRRAVVPIPAPPPRPMVSRLQPVQETVAPKPAATEAPRHALDAFLGARMDLRQGIIMSELLGRPLALRV